MMGERVGDGGRRLSRERVSPGGADGKGSASRSLSL